MNPIDLLQHVPNNHILKSLSQSISAATHIPQSSVFLLGLSVFSSVATRAYSVEYQYGGAIPIGLYTVIEQPSGAGKSWGTRTFQSPFFKIHKAVVNQSPSTAAALFTSNSTAEALEHSLIETNGFFSAVSSEQGLANSLLGLSYSNGAANNDVVLNGFDGGYIDSRRLTRQGYSGNVAGGVTLFAQQGSIEKVLKASNGTGLSERFLMLSEPHNLGKRDHMTTTAIDADLLKQYESICIAVCGESIVTPIPFESCKELVIDASGWRMINEYRNHIEPNLLDGGRYSHISLRSAAGKVDSQIMKIAANLHLLSDLSLNKVIDNVCVKAAIMIANDLLEHQLTMLDDKGLSGANAAHDAILRMFEKSAVLTDRQITVSRSNVEPFKSATGNRVELIRHNLNELVEIGILEKSGEGGKAVYSLPRHNIHNSHNIHNKTTQPTNTLDNLVMAAP